MQDELKRLEQEVIQKITISDSLKELNEIRVVYLGKKGLITEVLRGMGKLSSEERPIIGQIVNEIREEIEKQIEAKQQYFEKIEVQKKLSEETIDVTLPGKPIKQGNRHPLMAVIEDIMRKPPEVKEPERLPSKRHRSDLCRD